MLVSGGQRDVCGSLNRLKIFIFFFQAEDGIRDWSVTGVQTCALPISKTVLVGLPEMAVRESVHRIERALANLGYQRHTRSEERRVGKECRSRWSPDH